MKTRDQLLRLDNFMPRFKASAKWMSEDLGCKTHILQPGGLKMSVMKKLVSETYVRTGV